MRLQAERQRPYIVKGITGVLTTILLVLEAGPGLAQEAERIARGQFHYQRYCAACHGEKGKGDGPLKQYLKVAPSDLTQFSQKSEGQFPFWYVYRTIEGSEVVKGHGTREMPVWGTELRLEESRAPLDVQPDLVAGRIWQLILYIESLQAQ